MKLFRILLPIAVVLCCFTTFNANAAEYSSTDEFNERDCEAVTNFVKSKRMLPLTEKGCDLMISGDIRAEWESISEKHDGINLRGRNAPRTIEWFNGAPPPENQFDVEFNLMIDYKGGCTWGVAHIEMDNNAGIDINPRGCAGDLVYGNNVNDPTFITGNREGDPHGCHGSGICSNICLRKAYFGYNLFEQCSHRIDIELGRRYLYDVFDSRVQFRSRFDGLLLRYTNAWECFADMYVNAGAMVVDENVDHFAWALEMGLLNIADYGIDVKYSFIDWTHSEGNRCDLRDPIGMRFRVSQFTFAYSFNPELICTQAKIYGAFLINHNSFKRLQFNNKSKDMGWYVGFQVGEVRREGDWHFDINYQIVEAGVIPDCDMSGIGRGNIQNRPITVNTSNGNVNYKGLHLEALYALTDNIAINPSWNSSQEEDATIGGKHNYSCFELQFIYAF